jgi:hypothetical protein
MIDRAMSDLEGLGQLAIDRVILMKFILLFCQNKSRLSYLNLKDSFYLIAKFVPKKISPLHYMSRYIKFLLLLLPYIYHDYEDNRPIPNQHDHYSNLCQIRLRLQWISRLAGSQKISCRCHLRSL